MTQPSSQYDDAAAAYEAEVVPRFRVVADRLLEIAAPATGEAVLDVAAGTGGLARLIQPRLGPTGRLVVTDLSQPMLDVAAAILGEAKADGPALELLACDLERLPFADATFDLVVAQFTPLQGSAPGLREAARVLRPGGRLAIAWWGPAYRELELLDAVRRRIGIAPQPNPDPTEAVERVREAGFRSIEHTVETLAFSHADVAAYLDYRRGFGRANAFDDDLWARYWAALEREATEMAEPDGRLELTWAVALLSART